jgi:hypothetical protein
MTQTPTKDELLERAAELGIEGRSNMNKDELAAAIAAAGGAATYGVAPEHRPDDVSARAIDAPPVASQRVPSRRGVPDDRPRAETTGYYHDLSGKRRVVGAGQVVPEGWVRVGDRDLAERAANVGARAPYDHFPGRAEPRA